MEVNGCQFLEVKKNESSPFVELDDIMRWKHLLICILPSWKLCMASHMIQGVQEQLKELKKEMDD